MIYDHAQDDTCRINHTFEFEDCVVDVKGLITIQYDYFAGDNWTAPYSKLVYIDADIHEAVRVYEDSSEPLTNEELDKLEKLIEK